MHTAELQILSYPEEGKECQYKIESLSAYVKIAVEDGPFLAMEIVRFPINKADVCS